MTILRVNLKHKRVELDNVDITDPVHFDRLQALRGYTGCFIAGGTAEMFYSYGDHKDAERIAAASSKILGRVLSIRYGYDQ